MWQQALDALGASSEPPAPDSSAAAADYAAQTPAISQSHLFALATHTAADGERCLDPVRTPLMAAMVLGSDFVRDGPIISDALCAYSLFSPDDPDRPSTQQALL